MQLLNQPNNPNKHYNVHFVEDFEIQDLGIQEEYVYDIEVQKTHSFFANNTLVHNSCYYTIAPFVKKKFGENASAHDSNVIDWCDKFQKEIIEKLIQKATDDYSAILNVYDPSQIGVEREVIADNIVFVAKKKYFARVMDIEGVRYNLDDPYIKIMGLEIARSSTPAFCRDKLEESIGVILDQDLVGLKRWRDQVRLEFLEQPIEEISMVQGISSLDYNLGDKGVPQGPKSALAHNKWVLENGLEQEIELLVAGEKYKRCYLKMPNRFGSEVISYSSGKIAKIIEQDGIFDYSKNFEVQFEKPLERMVEGMGYIIEDKPSFDNLSDW